FFFQAEDGIRDDLVTGVQTCALPISPPPPPPRLPPDERGAGREPPKPRDTLGRLPPLETRGCARDGPTLFGRGATLGLAKSRVRGSTPRPGFETPGPKSPRDRGWTGM